jgi:PPOX class probable F420-dependent enzyme
MTLNQDNPRHVEADARLRAEPIAWLTVVTGSGQPQSTPVWFLWDGSEFLIYGSKSGPKTANIQAHPQVSLHLEGNGTGGGNVIFEGAARIDPDGPRADAVADYVAKYQERVESYGWTLASFAADYPHVIRVTPTRARIW